MLLYDFIFALDLTRPTIRNLSKLIHEIPVILTFYLRYKNLYSKQ